MGGPISCDVCVVGAGAAGITLALELGRASVDVVLLEAGGKRWNKDYQDLYKGEVTDSSVHSELDAYRIRQLGGTTTVWGGRCIPFDEVDFERRDFVPFSGWPITRKDLDPFYARAHRYCHLGNYAYTVEEALTGAQEQMVPGLPDGDVVTNNLERFSLPTDFGKEYRDELRDSTNIRLFLHGNCTNIEVDDTGTRVVAVEACSLEKNRFRVLAKAFVLSAGGLEVTRLLLSSNRVHTRGIGNHSDLLGRFYMSHLSGIISEVEFRSRPIVVDYEIDPEGVYCRRRFTISKEAQLRHKILNFMAFLDHPPVVNPSHGNGLLSGMFLAKNVRYLAQHIRPEFSKDLSIVDHPLNLYRGHVRNVAVDLGKMLRFAPGFCYKRFLKKRKLPSIVIKNASNRYCLRYHVEQSPRPDSRVTLSDERDALGMRRLHVRFRYNDIDVESIQRAHELIGCELQRHGCGTLRFLSGDVDADIRRQVGVGSHHIGTTRMAQESSQGVVDENCRVHGIINLFVASNSVFPTSSQANPTLTIVAIAIRVANSLQRLCREQP